MDVDVLYDVDVWFRELWKAAPTRSVKLGDDEIEQIRELLVVDVPKDGFWRSYSIEHRVTAPQADVDRWQAATEAIVAAHESVEDRATEAYRRQWPPRAFGPRLVWLVRYQFRKGKRRREYENTIAALEVEILDAYRAYRDAAGDLTEHVKEEQRREERERREEERRKRLERELAMLDAVDGAVWACQVNEVSNRRRLQIWLPAIGRHDVRAHGEAQLGLTARQVQQAIDRERENDEYIWIDWGYATGIAMKEWYALQDHDDAGTNDRTARQEELAWQALAGVLVRAIKLRPEELRNSRTRGHGPSSNYWSPSGDSFGTSF